MKRATRVSALNVIGSILVISALIRLAGADFTATAQEPSNETIDEVSVVDIPFSPESIDIILEALQRREAVLREAELQVEERRRILGRTEADLEQKIEELENVEQRLAATLSLADTAAETDIEKLAVVYENMKPKDAAEIFAVMAPNFAAGFMSRMQPESAAAVMSELEPDVGHTISVIFAGRNADAFQEEYLNE